MKKVAIIGAGMAGLACARVLSKSGYDVQVFDKGRGPGGRMSTRRVPTDLGEVRFDHGAQYFTARDPDFLSEVSCLIDMGAVGIWAGDLLRHRQGGAITPLAAEDLYVGIPSMNAVIKALGEGGSIVFSTRVETIQAKDKAWGLISDTGVDLGIFDAIVCAVPAEQVAPLLGEVAPRFADMSQAITSLPCWAGLFAFDRPLSLPFDGQRLDDHDSVDFIARNDSKPGRTGPASYVVHARADWSRSHIEDTPHATAKHLLDALLAYSDDKANVIHASAHRWRFAKVDVKHGPGFMFDSDTTIGVCGDWLSGPRVESAWLSGHKLGLAMTGQMAEPDQNAQTRGE